MRLVVQRVSSAAVKVAGETVGEIGRGLLVLVGIERGDGPEAVRAAAEKLAGLRIFEDDAGKMNLDTAAVGGAFLVVSQFTLAGSLARGRRPSFDRAAPPEEAAAAGRRPGRGSPRPRLPGGDRPLPRPHGGGAGQRRAGDPGARLLTAEHCGRTETPTHGTRSSAFTVIDRHRHEESTSMRGAPTQRRAPAACGRAASLSSRPADGGGRSPARSRTRATSPARRSPAGRAASQNGSARRRCKRPAAA